MRTKRRYKLFITTLVALCALLLGAAVPALAQCAMCKASASGLDAESARQLNIAVVMMVSPPVAIFCAFIYLTYKHRRPPEDEE